jgi:hypothetical protein
MSLHAILALVAFWLGAPSSVPLADVERLATSPEEAIQCLVWMHHESDFGRALAGHRWDGRAYGILQVRDAPWLERDPTRSVEAWLRLKRLAASACGDDGLAGLSSGRCDRGTQLAGARRAEATFLEMAARIRLSSPAATP